MRSIDRNLGENKAEDDRTAKARIRDAAIVCISEHGVTATTARKVATTAGVSPGLVIHHFGSMEGLRAACDEFVASTIEQQKLGVMSSGPGLDVLAALRQADAGHLVGYLAAVLSEDSPMVEKLIDDMVDDAEGYLTKGVESGMLKPSDDVRGRAVMLALWGLGSLVLHQHLKRLLGVDLTDPDFMESPHLAAYVRPIYEIYSEGIFTDEFGAQAMDALATMTGEETDGRTASSPTSDAKGTTTNKGTS